MDIKFIRTAEAPHAYPLAMNGEWLPGDLPLLRRLRDRFTQDDEKGDPRSLVPMTEDASIAVRDGQVGMLLEVELNVYVSDADRDNPGATPSVKPSTYQTLVEHRTRQLERLQQAWEPLAEIFLADGPALWDYRLTLCAFVPLRGDEKVGYSSPFDAGADRSIDALHDALVELAFTPSVRMCTATTTSLASPGPFLKKETGMSQHIIQVQTPTHGEVEIIIGWDGPCREFFGNALSSEEDICYQSAPREELPSIKAAILAEFGVDLPPSMIAGAEQDQRDHQAGQFIGRRVVVYDANGVVVQRNDH